MRLGIDLDGTISNTGEIYRDRRETFARDKNITIREVEEDFNYKKEFLKDYSKEIFLNVDIKENAKEVLQRLKEKHEIYIITARSNDFVPDIKDVAVICQNWFDKYNIVVDKIITGVDRDEKLKECLQNKIDLMIDDNINNYEIIKNNLKCLLFDDNNQYNSIKDRVTNWLELEKYVEEVD